jgi:hypothetical protein
VGENRKLVFAPPVGYDLLVAGCLLFGLFAIASGFFGGSFLFVTFGLAVFLSGIWAALSNERIAFDLKARTYARLEGQGVVKKVSRGSLSKADALVVIASWYPYALGNTRMVDYRIVLHWKNSVLPPLVLERETHQLGQNEAVNGRASEILKRSERYARALKLPLYDNSYFVSDAPLPVL